MPATSVDEDRASRPCERVARYSEITGTKACENAPSAKKRRSRFGIRNATANASITGPAPNQVENAMSRASPVQPRQQRHGADHGGRREQAIGRGARSIREGSALALASRLRLPAHRASRGSRGPIGHRLDLPTGAPNNTALFRLRPGPRPERTHWPISNPRRSAPGKPIKRRAHNVAMRSSVRTAIRKSAEGRRVRRQRGGERQLQGRRARRSTGWPARDPAEEPRRALQEPAQREATRDALSGAGGFRARAAASRNVITSCASRSVPSACSALIA